MKVLVCLLVWFAVMPIGVDAQTAPPAQQAQKTSDEQAKPSTKANHKERMPIYTAHRFPLVPVWLDIRAGIGYSYTNLEMPSAGRVNLSGAEVPLIADVAPSFGITAEASYVASNVFNSSAHADVLSYLIGPTLYLLETRRLRFYAQGLVGGARVAGPITVAGPSYFVNRLSWAAGGGAEYRLSHGLLWRSGMLYQKTNFFGSSLGIEPQNDFRFVSSIVFLLREHPHH